MAWTPTNYNYSTDLNRSAQYQRFSTEYFSGADTRIYFGDQWVDEITNLSFTLMENVQPIYGYSSYTYDAVAKGNRQVQGQFSINFKESYYLHSVTNRLEQKMREQEASGTKEVTTQAKQYNSGITLEHLLSKAATDSETSFETYAMMFEKSLWGESGGAMQKLTNNRGDESFFTPESGRPNLARDGFNILVLYGAYGDSVTDKTTERISKTAHSIVGVHITGVSQVVDASGSPIQEVYNFIAKDLDWNINLKA